MGWKMSAELAKRIRERLSKMHLRPSQADRKAGLSLGFTRDLLAGRKEQPRRKGLQQLAAVLECDLGYLLLEQRVPRMIDGMSDTFQLLGYCEVGIWREERVPASSVIGYPCPPREQYPRHHQGVYEVLDDHALELGIVSGSRILVLSKEGMIEAGVIPAPGDAVVIERKRSDLVETTIVEVSSNSNVLRRIGGAVEQIAEFEIRAIVLISTMRFL